MLLRHCRACVREAVLPEHTLFNFYFDSNVCCVHFIENLVWHSPREPQCLRLCKITAVSILERKRRGSYSFLGIPYLILSCSFLYLVLIIDLHCPSSIIFLDFASPIPKVYHNYKRAIMDQVVAYTFRESQSCSLVHTPLSG